MADNINVKDASGTTKTLQTTDNSSVHTPAHQIVRSDGTVPLKPVAEDGAHTSTDAGIIAMAVRQDTPANLSGTDLDYEPLQVSAGRLWASAKVTDVVPGTAATNLGKAEDAAHGSGDTGVFVLAVRNDTHTTALAGTDGDYTAFGVDSSGKLGIRGTFAEDAAHTTGDLGVHVLTVRQDTAAALSGTDADYQPFITDGSGRLHVNVGSFTPGTAAGSLGKAEDAAHGSGDTGVMMLGVRQDTAAALGGTDADYMPMIFDSTGRLWVHCSALEPGTAASSLGKAEDAAHTTGDVGVMLLGVRNDTHTTALSGTDADYTPMQVDSTGKVGIRGTFAEDAAHTTGDLGLQMLTVRQDTATALGGTDADYQPLITDGSGRLHCNIGALTPGTAAANLGKAEDAAHSSGDTGVMMLGVRNDTHTTALAGTDADYTPLGVDSSGKLGIRGTFAEDAAHTTGDLGVHMLSVRNDADAALSGTDLDYTPQAVDSAGRQKVNTVEERVILDVTPVCDTSAYTAADVLFDRITCGTVARVNGGTVVLESVTILDEDDQAAAEMDLYFLDSDVTLGTANAAISISDADARKLVGHVNIPAASFKDLINSKFAVVKDINLAMKCDAASQILYVAGVTAGTPTQTASGIKLKLAFRRG